MAQYPTELIPTPQELPAAVDQATLNERGLFVLSGLTKALAEQLVTASKQSHIAEFCPNDPTKRFGDVEKVAAWQSKGRLSLPLVRKTGDGAMTLAGFGWMGPGKPGDDEPAIPGATTTFAIRIYQDALGAGNALPYTRAILGAHKELYSNDGVWLEAWADNGAAVSTYHKAGFETVAQVPGERHGQAVDRVYMSLAQDA